MNRNNDYGSVLHRRADAAALIGGSDQYPGIRGRVLFWQTRDGVIVCADISGLPKGSMPCGEPIFAFHIHGGAGCSGNEEDRFVDAGTHYNPGGCPHPYHAGDLPPLFGAGGMAFSVFLTGRFSVDEIIGKTVIIHSAPDDFTTQPSGNSGEKIACGVITSVK